MTEQPTEPGSPPGLIACSLNEVRIPANCTHSDDSWFDRTLCPEPCGMMHDRCTNCGFPFGGCVLMEGEEW